MNVDGHFWRDRNGTLRARFEWTEPDGSKGKAVLSCSGTEAPTVIGRLVVGLVSNGGRTDASSDEEPGMDR